MEGARRTEKCEAAEITDPPLIPLTRVLTKGMKQITIASIVFGLAAASPVAAQDAPSAGTCDSVLRAARADSVPITARVYLTRRDGETLPPRARLLLADAILMRFEPPKPLQLPVFGPGPAELRILRRETLAGDSLTIREPVVYGLYTFTIRRSGGVDGIATRTPTMVPGFDERITAAIRSASADSALAAIGHALDRDSLVLDLKVTTGPEDTRRRVPPATLFAATFPRLRLVDAKPLPPAPVPQYPEDERDDGRDGDVLLRVVVDGSGAPVISTLEVLHATSSAFALAAAKTLARYHFAPAHVGACTVPQVVLLPFWFSLRP